MTMLSWGIALDRIGLAPGATVEEARARADNRAFSAFGRSCKDGGLAVDWSTLAVRILSRPVPRVLYDVTAFPQGASRA